MVITTKSPIIYSNAFGDKLKEFVVKQKAKRDEKKASGQPTLLDKAKGLLGKSGQQATTNTATTNTATTNTATTNTPTNVSTPTPEKSKLSTGVKIGIGIGGAIVIGLIIFLITRPKK